MKTKEELLAEFEDELRGLLESALADAEKLIPSPQERTPIQFAALGAAQVKRWQRARRLLERIHAFCEGPVPVKNGQHPVQARKP